MSQALTGSWRVNETDTANLAEHQRQKPIATDGPVCLPRQQLYKLNISSWYQR
jgi:hypothetical protein